MLSFRPLLKAEKSAESEYSQWYGRDCALALVSCLNVFFSAFVEQEYLKNLLLFAGGFSEIRLIVLCFYLKDRTNPKWLTILQKIIRIALLIILIIGFTALCLTDREMIRDKLYH